ncbi:hypothetical protein SSTU70S_01101 [Stutzerimonas stutzeri]
MPAFKTFTERVFGGWVKRHPPYVALYSHRDSTRPARLR